MPRYDGRCRSLSEEELRKMESAGLHPVLRFRVEEGPFLLKTSSMGR